MINKLLNSYIEHERKKWSITIFTSLSLNDTLDDCNTMTNLIFVLVA